MKKLTFLITILLIVGLATNSNAQYCAGGPTSTFDSNVLQVDIVGETVSLSHTGCPGVTGVEDLTGQLFDVIAGNTYTLSVTFATCANDYAGVGEVWIDWNQDFVFDPVTELIGTSSGTPGITPWDVPVDFIFTVPIGAGNGLTIMRIIQEEGGVAPLDPCSGFAWGSAMEFSVIVGGGVNLCTFYPINLTATGITSSTADLAWTQYGSATAWNIEFGTTGFIPTGTPTQTGVTNPYNMIGLTASTTYDYYVQADCGSTWNGPFTFTTLAACAEPTALNAVNILPTSANLGWTEMGTAVLWNIEFGIAGFTPTGTPTNLGVTNPFNITGLTAQTSYDYYVQADCGGSTSIWTGPFTFTTPCNAFVAPYLESFENGGLIPACWTSYSTSGELWQYNITNGGHSAAADHTTGTGYFAWVDDSESPSSNDVTLESPFVDVSGLTVPQLSFWLFSNNEGGANASISIDIWDGTAWNIGVFTNTGNTIGWEEKTIDLSLFTITGPVQARFIVDEFNGDYFDDISLDDVNFRETPTCPDPLALGVLNISDISTDLIWTEAGTATNWYIEWGPTGFTPGTGTLITNVTTNPYTLTGLTPVTSYDFYVQSVCGVGDSSLWIGPFNFLTTACAITEQCVFALDIWDDWGDGWNGAAIDVIQDGIVVGTYTLTGGSYATFNINLCDSSLIELSWTSGSFDGECSMMITDPYNRLLYEFAVGNAPAAGVFYSFMASCSPPPPADLVITEIMYNPPESGADSLEFFEIYNNDTLTLDMYGYALSYNANTHIFDMGTIIFPGDYVVVAIDSAKFEAFYGFAPIQSQSTTGVGNGGATVTLYDNAYQLVDSVIYDDIAPWPTEPDGTGPSLVLCDYMSDNTDGNNWFASIVLVGQNGAGTDVFASPGGQDSICTILLPADLAIVFPDTVNYDCGLSATEQVPYCISNVGSTDVPVGDTIFIYYEYPLGNVVADTLVLANDLIVGDTLCGTFTQTVDFSAIAIYDFEIYFSYFNDLINLNDTLIGSMEHYQVVVDLGGVNDTITVSAYPTTLDAGACTSPGGFICTYLWSDASTAQTLAVNTDGWYYVTVSDDNWCSGMDSVYVVLNISINDIDNTFGLNIYPNPTNNKLNIEVSTNEKSDMFIDLINVQGQLIERRVVENTMLVNEQFNVKGVSPGVYYLKVTSGKSIKVEKVVIQ